MKALKIHITGVVQGVGFRPFIYNLANELNLTGWVLNGADGVHVFIEGPAAVVDSFPVLIERAAPVAARIDGIHLESARPVHYVEFEIRESAPDPNRRTLVSPDMATCQNCASELFDEADRRFRYPFINCTDCGPRFTIIKDIPYDRAQTTMSDFPLCDDCANEYADPTNRRFHAQPNACFVCGPRIYLNGAGLDPSYAWSPEVEQTPRPHREHDAESARSSSIILEVVEMLHADKIVALKGLGGFHLAVNARNWSAVERLRERKHRYGKPLAVMFANIEQVRRYCEVSDEEQALLEGPVRPIVLLKRRGFVEGQNLAENIAQGMPEVGAVLPYTPLHHLLLDEYYGPLVMTSGNLSDEPIATANAEALERLDGIADVFLMHDRDIHMRYDDSVARVVDGHTQIVRRARGYAPFPLPSPFAGEGVARPILAVGPEQKHTFTLLDSEHTFVSQHIGDLENTETLAAFEEAEELYEKLFRVKPRIIAHDMHPEYLSTKWAKGRHASWGSKRPIVAVQHHHAHIVAVTAENGYRGDVIGVALDGTGYGDDGTIWGGEVLIANWREYERFAHLRQLPLPGGAAAVKRPLRYAIGMLGQLDLLDRPGALPILSRAAKSETQNLLAMIEHGINSPMTSSMGRLFDAVAALIGVADEAIFEGSPAILLEGISTPLDSRPSPAHYRFSISGEEQGPLSLESAQLGHGIIKAPAIIDMEPIISAVLNDIEAGWDKAEISRRFHSAVVMMVGDIATKAALATGLDTVALSGGCFMNRLLLSGVTQLLELKGFTVLTHRELPVNDGCISYGQAVAAHERIRTAADTSPDAE